MFSSIRCRKEPVRVVNRSSKLFHSVASSNYWLTVRFKISSDCQDRLFAAFLCFSPFTVFFLILQNYVFSLIAKMEFVCLMWGSCTCFYNCLILFTGLPEICGRLWSTFNGKERIHTSYFNIIYTGKIQTSLIMRPRRGNSLSCWLAGLCLFLLDLMKGRFLTGKKTLVSVLLFL